MERTPGLQEAAKNLWVADDSPGACPTACSPLSHEESLRSFSLRLKEVWWRAWRRRRPRPRLAASPKRFLDIAVTNASPPSSLVDVGQLAAALERFAAERNWAQFHSPKNLVMALTGEVGELSEIFQWMDEEQSKDAARHPDTAQAVQDELADVLMYLVRLASVLGVDLDAAARQKLEQNNRKYPVEKARNSSKKYDQF